MEEEPRAFALVGGVRGELDERVFARLRALSEAQNALERDGVGRIKGSRRAKRGGRLSVVAKVRAEKLRLLEEEGKTRAWVGRVLQARRERALHELPPTRPRVEDALEKTRLLVMLLLGGDLADQGEGSLGILVAEDARCPRDERRPHGRLRVPRFLKERAGEGGLVAAPFGHALKTEDGAPPARLDGEHRVVRARGEQEVPGELLLQKPDALEVRDLALRILRVRGCPLVDGDAGARLAGRRPRRKKPRKALGCFGVRRVGDPRGVEMLARLLALARSLGRGGRQNEELRARRSIVLPRGLALPELPSLALPRRLRACVEPVERLREGGVLGIRRARLLQIAGRHVHVARFLGQRGEDQELVRAGARAGDEAEPRAAGANRVQGLPVGLVDRHEVVEDAPEHPRRRPRSPRRALEERHPARRISEALVGHARGVELEGRGARVVFGELRLVVEEHRQRARVAVARGVSDAGRAHRPHLGPEGQSLRQLPPGEVGLPEAPIEDSRSLHANPGREPGLVPKRLGEEGKVGRKAGDILVPPDSERGFEPAERGRMVGTRSEGALPGLDDVVMGRRGRASLCPRGLEHTRALREQVGLRVIRRRGEDLGLEVRKDACGRRGCASRPPEERVRGGRPRMRAKGRLRVLGRARAVPQDLIEHRELEVRAGLAHRVRGVAKRREPRTHERLGLLARPHGALEGGRPRRWSGRGLEDRHAPGLLVPRFEDSPAPRAEEGASAGRGAVEGAEACS